MRETEYVRFSGSEEAYDFITNYVRNKESFKSFHFPRAVRNRVNRVMAFIFFIEGDNDRTENEELEGHILEHFSEFHRKSIWSLICCPNDGKR
jgi:hypothetical protein